MYWGGSTGTGAQEGYGTGWSFAGDEVYVLYDEVDAGNSYAGSVYIGCDLDGAGMFVAEWDMSVAFGGNALGTIVAQLSSPRKYLPAEADLGGRDAWLYSYSYSYEALAGGLPVVVTTEGVYTELAMTSITLYDRTTYDAYHTLNEHTVDYGGYGQQSGELEQWYVAGLGLVAETTTDPSTGELLFSRELTGYTGLTPR